MMKRCIKCGSENVFYSKKRREFVCEDCGASFCESESILPQKVFLSYGHDENEELVRLIYNKLRERGHDPWIDRYSIKGGSDWREAISRGILDSTSFLAFISQYSVRVPGVCLDEISIGVGNWNCRMQTILLEKGVAVPNSIRNVQWLDFSDWKAIRNSGSPSAWEIWFGGKMKELFEIVEDQRAAKVAGSISELERKLVPLSMALKLRTILREGIVGRPWLVNRIDRWFIESDSRPGLVMYGRPGSGKSVMSAYLCNFASRCAASFFFEWNNSMTRNARKFLCSLMFQLACSLEDYRARLIDWLKPRNAQALTKDELLNEGLLGLLNGLIDGNREKKLVVLDAIDEAMSKDDGIPEVLIRLLEGAPAWLKFFITSRPESAATETFQGFDKLDLDACEHETENDLREYVGIHVADHDAATRVMEKSAGSFVYARELVRLWKQDSRWLEKEDFPSGVGGVYYANFERLGLVAGEYRAIYRPVLEVLLAAREQLSRNELGRILGGTGNWEDVLEKLRSYVLEVRHGEETFLQVYHKTFREWLLSEAAGKYRIDLSRADSVFRRYILGEAERDACLTPYAARFATEHISGRAWEELPEATQRRLCVKLLEADRTYGYLEMEANHLELLERTSGRGYEYYMNALELYKKTSGKHVEELAREAASSMAGKCDEESSFELACQIAFAHFYAGNARKAYSVISEERDRHGADFWRNERHEAYYWHVVAVTAHDLDRNRSVVQAAKLDVEAYRREKRYYDQSVSMVNLFDGLMAVGDLASAEQVAQEAFKCSAERYYVGVDEILRICHGNLLQTEGRVMEALAEYETGLHLAKGIQKWDYVYGSIWRELAMARYGDAHCLESLEGFRGQAMDLGYRYLVSLADCFFVMAAHLLGKKPAKKMSMCLREIRDIGLPGHVLQAEICCQLDGVCGEDRKPVLACLSVCEGVKGEPLLVGEYLHRFGASWEAGEREACETWIRDHAEPVRGKREQVTASLSSGLPDRPKLSCHACEGCPAACCYDGVYLEEGEAEAIQGFVSEHANQFAGLPDPYIVPGDWPGMEGVPKTQRVPLHGSAEGYPSHFSRTRCVFCLETGECQLQRVASDLQLHPWKVKPAACWLFPLGGVRKERLSPPARPEDDPDRGENYPGFASVLPCTKEDAEKGAIWYEKYRHELEYFNYLWRNGLGIGKTKE